LNDSTSSPTIRDGLVRGRNLGLRYRLVLPQASLRGRSGARLGTAAGASLDFHDYRDYHPGDDLRHLDWSVYARSDREVVKLFREEVAPHLDLLLDCSRSMAEPAEVKASAAALLTAACAAAAGQAQCSRTIWQAAERIAALPNSADDPAAWQSPDFATTHSPDRLLQHSPPAWRPHGVRVVISDLLWDCDPRPLLSRLADRAASLTIIQLLSAWEENPTPQGASRLEDAETGEVIDLVVNPAACDSYRAALQRHRESWLNACRACGATFVTVTAEDFFRSERLSALENCGLLEVL